MKWKIVFKIQGYLLIILAAAMSISAIYSMANGLNDFKAILYGSIITCSIGLLLVFLLRTDQEVRAREGFVVVTLGWIFAALFGALPFYLHGSFGGYINCVFETMSGFTTTGATILTNIEIIPKGLLLWRSMTHWLGGMGIILLTIAILPILGISYGKLFNAEVPGPTKDRLSPKIKSTAKILWLIYLGMTFLETVLLMFGGMDLYNALCHTFGTLATGGFSTQNASVGMYNSVFIETVIIFFMYLAGINFALHFHLIKGNIKKFFANREWQVFTVVLLTAVGFIALNLYLSPNQALAKYKDFPEALRASFFQVFSITTTTGFTTENFNLWPAFSKFLLVILMFLGGCAGSTGGGLKQIRIIIIIKAAFAEIKKLVHPKGFFSVKVSGEAIHSKVIKNVAGFFIFFLLFFALITLFLTFQGYDIVTSFSASIATLGNIGPGLARVGAVENYAFFDPLSKIVLTFSMLLGRLEVYSVLILFYAVAYRNKQ